MTNAQQTSDKCIWIGIGIDIDLKDKVYPQITKLNNLLHKSHNSNYKFDLKINPPHINLYDLDIPGRNLEKADKLLNNLTKRCISFSIEMKKLNYFKYGIVFIQCELNKQLKTLEKEVVESIVHLKNGCRTKDYWQPWRQYNNQQRNYREQYGNPHILDAFIPHVTIGFIKEDQDKLGIIVKQLNKKFIPTTFIVKQINMAIQNSEGKTLERRHYKFF